MKKTFPPAPPQTQCGYALEMTVATHAPVAPPEPPPVEWADDLWALEKRCKERLLSGELEYGNVSFSKAPQSLIVETQEEIEDARNYLFMIWRRLQLMKEACDAEMGAIDKKDAQYREMRLDKAAE